MKKLINLLTVLIFMISPVIANAQSQGEKWVSLGEYLKDSYEKKGKYLVPKYTNAFQYVTKLAYKTPDETEVIPKSDIIINKVNHIENHGIPVFKNEAPLIVNQLFEISQNRKTPLDYNITDGDDGWKIIDLNGVGSLTSILVKQKSKTNNNDIFDLIYVSLDESQDPYKIKEEILKTNEEKHSKERQRKSSKDYAPINFPVIQ
ncbi:MAG: hypothetical protein J1E16_05990 [Muribaculaceae bacterium]|nr:hypothetical protein [Muribaculaceae bacterium]